MNLTLELPPEMSDRLRDEADRHGLSVEDYARRLLQESLMTAVSEPPATARQPLTDEEWEREVQAFEEECADIDAPEIPLEALRRENMYEDRGW